MLNKTQEIQKVTMHLPKNLLEKALKIFCLLMNSITFIIKLSNKSFGVGQNLRYIH